MQDASGRARRAVVAALTWVGGASCLVLVAALALVLSTPLLQLILRVSLPLTAMVALPLGVVAALKSRSPRAGAAVALGLPALVFGILIPPLVVIRAAGVLVGDVTGLTVTPTARGPALDALDAGLGLSTALMVLGYGCWQVLRTRREVGPAPVAPLRPGKVALGAVCLALALWLGGSRAMRLGGGGAAPPADVAPLRVRVLLGWLDRPDDDYCRFASEHLRPGDVELTVGLADHLLARLGGSRWAEERHTVARLLVEAPLVMSPELVQLARASVRAPLPAQRAFAARTLAAAAPQAGETRRTLLELARADGAPIVRAAALTGLGVTGASDDGALAALITALGSTHDEERRAASSALERIGAPALGALRRALGIGPSTQQVAALDLALGLAEEDAARVAIFEEALANESADLRRRACELLRRDRLPSPAAALLLVPALADGDRATREEALLALVERSSLQEASASALLRFLATPRSDVRAAAREALRQKAPDRAEHVAALIGALGAPEVWVQREATYDLAALGASARAAVPALAGLVHHPALGEDCIRALGAIGVVDPVVPFLDSGVLRLRRAAIEAVGLAGPAAGAAVPALVRAVEADDADLSRAAVTSIAAIGTAARAAVPVLEKLAAFEGQGPDAVRAVEAREAIARVQAPPRPAAWDLAPDAPPRVRAPLDGDVAVVGAARARVGPGEAVFVPAVDGQALVLGAGATFSLEPSADGPGLASGPGFTVELSIRTPWHHGRLVVSDVFELRAEIRTSTELLALTRFGAETCSSACVFTHPSTSPEPAWLRVAIVRDAPRRQVEVYVDGLLRSRGADFHVTGHPPRVAYVGDRVGALVVSGPCVVDDVVVYDYPRAAEQVSAAGLSLERR